MPQDLNQWVEQLFQHPELTAMGHAQRPSDVNLGLGWVYYGIARPLRPSSVVVIGSLRGFAPLVFGRALQDNREQGSVHFIDPSLVDDFWRDAHTVGEYFAGLGVTNIQHHLMTTQQFVETETYRELKLIGIVFIDGYHSEEQARFDYQAFCSKLAPDGFALFHDSTSIRPSRIYGADRIFTRTVKLFVDVLKKDPELQVLDLPFGGGVTIVRRVHTDTAQASVATSTTPSDGESGNA